MLNDAERTAAQLQAEVEARRQDSIKYQHLQDTIKTQLEQYQQSVDKMEDELENKFPRTDVLQEEFNAKKETLMNIKSIVGQY